MVYGTDTRSYNRSPERREMKKQVAEATAAFEAAPRSEVAVRWGLCHCWSFQFSHDPARHRELRGDWDWRRWQDRPQHY